MQQPIITAQSKDPLGCAVLDYYNGKPTNKLVIHSSMFDDDELPVPYLFRTFDQMPEIEQMALKMAKGSILDVGAGAGCHSLELIKMGKQVTAIDISPMAVDVMKKNGIDAIHDDFFSLKGKTYDTILFLMNGAGIAGSVENLPKFFKKLDLLLNAGGQILIDSSDVSYLYENEDGSIEIDINDSYYGEFDFSFSYGNICSDTFQWFYIDFETLSMYAREAGYNPELIINGKNSDYLVRLTK